MNEFVAMKDTILIAMKTAKGERLSAIERVYKTGAVDHLILKNVGK